MSDETNPEPGEQLHPANTPSESGSPTPAENPLGESTPPAPQVQTSEPGHPSFSQPATDLEMAFRNAVDTEVSKEEKTFKHGFTTPPQAPASLPKAFQNLSQDPLLANQELRALIGPEIARLQQLDATRGILSVKDVITGTFHD